MNWYIFLGHEYSLILNIVLKTLKGQDTHEYSTVQCLRLQTTATIPSNRFFPYKSLSFFENGHYLKCFDNPLEKN